MRKIFIDANYLLALNDPLDPAHDAALEISQEINSNTQIILSTNILLEAITLISQRVSKKHANEVLDELRSGKYQIIHPSEDQILEADKLFKSLISKNISYSDCISFIILKNHNITHVITFDKHFKQQGFIRVGIDD
jgi:uncharacterized protein